MSDLNKVICNLSMTHSPSHDLDSYTNEIIRNIMFNSFLNIRVPVGLKVALFVIAHTIYYLFCVSLPCYILLPLLHGPPRPF